MPTHRAEVARLWGVADVPARPGKTAVEMFEAAAAGEIKALWIACTNPAQSMPDQATVRRALERCEFVVVQEAFATTATCAYADLLLPATTWGEKDGTVTNSERRISRVRPAVAAPGEARDDWAIASDFARRLEARLGPRRPSDGGSLFDYPDPSSVWNEHRESTRGRDLDITGLSYAALDTAPALWPWPEGAAEGRKRLYADGVFATDDGRARFVDAPYPPPAEVRDARFPFALNTGRLRDQWHGTSRTGSIGRLFGHAPEPSVEMNAADMARLGLADGDLVSVASRRGRIVLPAQRSAAQAPAQVFIAMHWGEELLSGREPAPAGEGGERLAGVNALTQSAFCPQSKQPELKQAAVKVEKAALPWRLLALAWLPEDRVLAVREALHPLLRDFAFAQCVPFGRERSGVLFRAAAAEAPAASILEAIEAQLGLDEAASAGTGPRLHYADLRRGQRRTMRLSGAGATTRLEGFLLAGDIAAEAWIRPLLQEELPAEAYGRSLLAGGATPPVPVAARGRQVCSCFDVSESEIAACLHGLSAPVEAMLKGLQAELKCGTNCGSCLPELRRIVAAVPAAARGPGHRRAVVNRVEGTAARVHLVGAGPGDPELLTLKAVRAIRQATVLLVDDLVGEGVLRYARRSARIVHVGKRGGCASTPQAFIERLMVAEARRGERVVRLKGGDPFVFGRGGEEAASLRAAGVEVEVVNGITAGLAAATSIGVPLTHRDHAHGVVFVTGHARRDAAGAAIDWPTLAAAAAEGLTLVIYMGIATVEALQSGLCGALPSGTPVAVVQSASLPTQRQAFCTLGTLVETIASTGLGSPSIIVVGDVARAALLASPQTEEARRAS